MKILKIAILTPYLLTTSVYAADTGVDPELAKKLTPKELEAIESEAAKLKEGKAEGKAEEQAAPVQQVENEPLKNEGKSEEKKPEQTVERQRSLQRRQSMYQGFYSGHQVTQEPASNLTEGPIKQLNPKR